MKIVKNFTQWRPSGMTQISYSVEFEIQDSQGAILYAFKNIQGLPTYGVWIEAKNLIDTKFLDSLNIEYKIIEDKVIPVGLVEFNGRNYVQQSLPVVFNTIEEQVEYKNIVAQIEEAVKYQYVAKELRMKCLNKEREETQF